MQQEQEQMQVQCASIPPPSPAIQEFAKYTFHASYPVATPVCTHCVPWQVALPDYGPVEFTHPAVINNDCTKKDGGWADPVIATGIEFSQRVSYEGPIVLSAQGLPLNPRGRTGLCGRGLLGKWGPNHAADPIVTRYDPTTGCLQIVLITRGDNGQLAIPGGMVDAGEAVSQTLQREFSEEAACGCAPEQLDGLFNQDKKIVYKGIVIDPRNTDNSWMETTACHFHCDKDLGALLPLRAGDDAVRVRWQTIPENDSDFEDIYATHRSMILAAVEGMPRRLGSGRCPAACICK